MKLFDCLSAKKLVQQTKEKNLNFQRNYILKAIEAAALGGRSQLVIDYFHIKLYPEDYDFFESLGYKVKRERVEEKIFLEINGGPDAHVYYNTHYGIISW